MARPTACWAQRGRRVGLVWFGSGPPTDCNGRENGVDLGLMEASAWALCGALVMVGGASWLATVGVRYW